MALSAENRRTLGTALMILGGLLTVTIVPMVWGIPLFMIGRDIRRRAASGTEPTND